MKRKVLAFILCIVFVLPILSGCSGKGKDDSEPSDRNKETREKQETDGTSGSPITVGTEEKEKNKEMGRYIERELASVPISADSWVINMFRRQDGCFEAYTSQMEGGCSSFLLEQEGEWKEQNCDWLNGLEETKNQGGFITKVVLGQDGNYYASVTAYIDGMQKDALYTTRDGGKTAEKVNLPHLEEKTKISDSYSTYGVISTFQVLENGTIAIWSQWDKAIKFYSNKTGELLGEIENSTTIEYVELNVYQNKILVIGEDRKSVMVYDIEKDSKVPEQEKEYDFSSERLSTVKLTMDDKGSLFIADSSGIHRITKDGTLWETVVDGALTSLGLPNFTFYNLYVVKEGEREEYYVSGEQLLHFVFDETISAAPSQEITVYSLYENSTVRQAVTLYQKENPDVKVNYVVAIGKEGGIPSDYIKALNTELLAGHGADVLILSGLPVESYIEKGILEDISETTNSLVKEGKLLPNIAEAFQTEEGSVYQMPIRFMIPIMEGKKEFLEKSKSLAEMAEYAKEMKEKKYLEGTTSKRLLKDMLAYGYEEIFTSDGKIDRDNFIRFLENTKILADNMDTVSYDKEDEEGDSYHSGTNGAPGGDLFRGDALSIAAEECEISFDILKSSMDMQLVAGIRKEYQIDYETLENRFLPFGLVGLNRASGKKELALDFIRSLFGEKVQDTNVYDGFAVNLSSLEKWVTKSNGQFALSTTLKSGKNMSVTGEDLTEEEQKELLDLLKTADKPIIVDQTVQDMILEAGIPFLQGSMTSAQVADQVITKVNTYLSE